MSDETHESPNKKLRVGEAFEWLSVVSRVVDARVPNTVPKNGEWVIANKIQGRLWLKHEFTSIEEKISNHFGDADDLYRWFAFDKENKGRYRLRFTLCSGKQKMRCILQLKTNQGLEPHRTDLRLIINQEIMVSKMFTNVPIEPPHGISLECRIVPPFVKKVHVPALSSSYTLHPHQHDTIRCMLECAQRIRDGTHVTRSGIGFVSVEGRPDIAVDLYTGRPVVRSEGEAANQKNDWCGLMIADDVGAGKTLTMQSFVMADKERRTIQQPWLYSALVIVPPNLAKQWCQNGEKFFGSRIKIMVFADIRATEKCTWQQLKAADLVICTTTFLENPKAREMYNSGLISLVGGTSRLHMQKAARMGADPDIWKKVRVHPLLVAYDSLIVDEVAEMFVSNSNSNLGGCKTNRLFDMLMSVQSTYRWLMTATPELSCSFKFGTYASLLTKYGCEFVNSTKQLVSKTTTKEAIPPDLLKQFIATCVLRHEPDMGLCKLVRQTHLVDLTQAEQLVLFGAGPQRNNFERTLQLCSYSAAENDTDQGKWKTPDEVAKEMLEKLKKSLSKLEKSIRICQVENEGYQRTLDGLISLMDDHDPSDEENEENEANEANEEVNDNEGMSVEQVVEQRRIRNERRDVSRSIQENTARIKLDTTMRDEVQRKVSYVETQIALLTSEDNTCCICFETPENPAILPCAHNLCIECAKNTIKCQRKCPICREPVKLEQVLFVRQDGTAISKPNASRYGSKISKMLGTVTSIVDKQERCIIFVQFTILAKRILLALRDLGVHVSILEGTTAARAKRVEDLRQGKLNALVLSLEESAAGIDLTCASHVIFSHALHNPHSIDGCINTMHQAIARVHRAGQTAEAVHVHHFITKGTLEEELHNQLMQNIS